MKLTLRDPIYVGNKWYERDGTESLSSGSRFEYSEDDRKKAGQINNMLVAGLSVAAAALGAAAVLFA